MKIIISVGRTIKNKTLFLCQMVHYYLSCKVSRENVLTAELRNAQRAVVAVRQALAVLARGAPQLFNDPGKAMLLQRVFEQSDIRPTLNFSIIESFDGIMFFFYLPVLSYSWAKISPISSHVLFSSANNGIMSSFQKISSFFDSLIRLTICYVELIDYLKLTFKNFLNSMCFMNGEGEAMATMNGELPKTKRTLPYF